MYARVYRRDPSDVYKSLKFTRERKKRKSEIKKKKVSITCFPFYRNYLHYRRELQEKRRRREKKNDTYASKRKKDAHAHSVYSENAHLYTRCVLLDFIIGARFMAFAEQSSSSSSSTSAYVFYGFIAYI